MEKHLFVTSVPDSFKKEELNHGVNGTCYRTEDGDVYKEYFVHGVYDNITELLLGIKCPGFCMPYQLVFKGTGILKPTSEEYIGLRKDYAKGIRISDISDNVSMESLISAIEQFESNMLEMSYGYEVDLYDLNPNNLIFDENSATLTDIDTDVIQPFSVWYHQPTNPYYENMKLFASDTGIKMFFPDKYKSYLINEYKERCALYGHARVSAVIKLIIEELKKNGYLANNYGEYKKGLTLIKK